MNLSKCDCRETINQMYEFGESFRILGLYLKGKTNPFWDELYMQAVSAFERRSAGLMLAMIKRLSKSLPEMTSPYQRCQKIIALADKIDDFDNSFHDDRLYAAACLSYVSGLAFNATMHSPIESTRLSMTMLKNFREFTEEDYRYAKHYLGSNELSLKQGAPELKAYVGLLDAIFA